MRGGLQLKFNLFIVILVLITVLVISIIGNRRLSREITDNIKEQALTLSAISQEAIFDTYLNILMTDGQKKKVIQEIVSINENITNVEILSPSGYILFDFDAERIGRLQDNEAIRQGLDHQKVFYSRSPDVMEVVSPYSRNDYYYGAVKYEFSLEPLRLTIRRTTFQNILIGFLIALGASLLSLFFVRFITRPLKVLTRHVKNYSLGQYDEPLDVRSGDEIQSLAEVFSQMQRQLLWERKRIAYNIHDTLTQNLSAVAMQIKDEEVISGDKLKFVSQLIQQSVDESRQVIFELNPLRFEDNEFIYAIRQFLSRTQKKTGISCHLDSDFDDDDRLIRGGTKLSELLSHFHLVNIMYIIIEAFNNVKKHSKATAASLSIRYLPDGGGLVALRIEDNGRGFTSLESGSGSLSFGLAGIRERVKIMKGRVSFEPAGARGSRIRIEIPTGGV